jgi:hypothetical protein
MSVADDVHHKRTDLRHDPSFHDEADGGVGVQLDGGLVYRLWRGLSVEAGYQYWRVKSGGGTSTATRCPAMSTARCSGIARTATVRTSVCNGGSDQPRGDA